MSLVCITANKNLKVHLCSKSVKTIPSLQLLVKIPMCNLGSMAQKQPPCVTKWAKNYKRPFNFPSLNFMDIWWGCFLEFILKLQQFILGPLVKSCEQLTIIRAQVDKYSYNQMHVNIMIVI